MNSQRVEALLKVRQQLALESSQTEDSRASLSCPSLNSSIIMKNKALSQSLATPKWTSEDIEKEVQRLESIGHAHVQHGMRDTLEASLV
jgi:hypothetical protein